MHASDIGFMAGLQDAIEHMTEKYDSASRMRGCHYTGMNAADTTEARREHRAQYEFYDGKRDAYADALKALHTAHKQLMKEYEQ